MANSTAGPEGGFVGLDPDLCRSLAGKVNRAGDDAGVVATKVGNILSAADIRDSGSVKLINEIDEEFGLLASVLKSKANQIETPGSRQGMVAYDSASAALWASLTDKTGAGFDAKDDWIEEGGEVPLSPSSASSVLAEFLRSKGPKATVDGQGLVRLLDDPSVPVEVRAAAKYMIENDEVFANVVGYSNNEATASKFDDFIVMNKNLAIVAGMYDRLDTAKQASQGVKKPVADGVASPDDMWAAVRDTTGRFSPEEIAALLWVQAHRNMMLQPVESRQNLMQTLVNRQVFAENPKLAVDCIRAARKNPKQYLSDQPWFDSAGSNAWLRSATAATTDPKEREKLVLDFVSIYQDTKPDVPTTSSIIHGSLDAISFVDPTQIADVLNTVIYVAEGDYKNAGFSAAGILLPLAGGAAIRLTKKTIVRLALNETDEAGEAIVKAIANGTLNHEVMTKAVKEVGEEFGDDTAKILQKNLDEAVEKAEKQASDSASSATQRGAERAAKFSGNWQTASLKEKVAEFAGPNPLVTTTAQKTVYTNTESGMQVVYDRAGEYFTILDKDGKYMMLNGKPVPANVPVLKPNGGYAMSGVSADVRKGLTHFKAIP